MVRQVLYKPSMEIQCQRSCPPKRTGGDDWPLQKVSRNEDIIGYSRNSVHQKEQGNLGIFTWDDNKVPKCGKSLLGIICEPVHTK